MITLTNENLKPFCVENLQKLSHPSQNKEVNIQEVDRLCELLLKFLSYRIDDPTLERIKANFEFSYSKILSLDLQQLPNAIETLATTFESFLRKIAYCRYYGTTHWAGDEEYIGINKSTLADLIAGDLPSSNPISGAARKKLPTQLVDSKGTKGAIYNFVRDQLRNAVHYAKAYNRQQLINYSNYAIGVYLMAINDNKEFLSKILYPHAQYLENILQNKELARLNNYYIDLFGMENLTAFDNIAIEKLDGHKLIQSLDSMFTEDEQEEKEAFPTSEVTARIDTVLNIAKEIKRFIIIGDPGSGKSTTLLKLQYEYAREYQTSNEPTKLPIYITANYFGQSRSFVDIIKSKLKVNSLSDILEQNELILLIDGLNEIDDSLKKLAYNDLKVLLSQLPTATVIISTRSFSFFNYWDLPVFELTDLNESQVRQLIKNVLGQNKGEKLWQEITEAKNIGVYKLCRTPLLLMMLIKVSTFNQGKIPSNKGTLYKIFNDAILERERKIYITDPSIKLDVLSHLAFWMRDKGHFRRVNIEIAKDRINDKLSTISKTLGLSDLFKELIDNNFFSIFEDDIEFLHETYQEYFVALEIRKQFQILGYLEFDYSDDKWFEPLLICADLFSSDHEKINYLQFLYTGRKSQLRKSIYELNKDDVNDNFTVACKLAFHLKLDPSNVYSKIETYLNNYLIIWYVQQCQGVTITSFEKIIKAVSSLSSAPLLLKLFTELRYLHFWFYNSEYENFNTSSPLFEETEIKFREHSKIFIDNLADFQTAYEMLEIAIKSRNISWVQRSITTNLKRFKTYLIQNTSNTILKSTFHNHNSRELLTQIGKTEIDFYIEHFSLVSDKPESLYMFIMKYHLYNRIGREFLAKSLNNDSLSYQLKLKISNALLNIPELLPVVFLFIKSKLEDESFKPHLPIIRKFLTRVSFRTLEEYGISKVYHLPEVQEIIFKCEIIKQSDESGFMTVRIPNYKIPSAVVHNFINNIYENGIHVPSIFIKKDPNRLLETKKLVLGGPVEHIQASLEKCIGPGQMTIMEGSFLGSSKAYAIDYTGIEKCDNQSRMYLYVSDSNYASIHRLIQGDKQITIILNQRYSFRILNLSAPKTKYSVLKIKPSAAFKRGISITLTGYLVKLDTKNVQNYHRDSIRENIYCIHYLKYYCLQNNQIMEFSKKLSLLSTLSVVEENADYNIVTFIKQHEYHTEYFLQGIETGETYRHVSYNQDFEINIYDIVTIESKWIITKIHRDTIPQKHFINSRILQVDPVKKEGFIRNASAEKDFYFPFSHLDFAPKAGDLVEFIPGKNPNKRYIDLPIAYCVRKVNVENRIAKLVNFIKVNDYYNLFLEDAETSETLFSRIYLSECKDIRHFNGVFEKGQRFNTQIISDDTKLGRKKKVHLVEYVRSLLNSKLK